MKLGEVKQVEQTTLQDEVNALLRKGFCILRIFNSRIKDENVEQVMPIYVLGKI